MNKRQLITIAFCCFAAFLSAQDRHFSQFYSSPLTLNPALTGLFDGKYRVGGIYRDQWRGMLERPYQNFSFGADLRMDVPFMSKSNTDKFGVGLLFYRDIIKALDFSTTQVAISGAYHKSLSYNNTQYLSLGFQLGLSQRNVNYDNLTFQDQWNGVDGYSLPRGELLPTNNFGYSDLSTGLNYVVNPAPKVSITAGIAYHHFNKPNVAFFKGADIPKQTLFPRLSGQLAIQFPINKQHSIMMSPRILVAQQGPHLEINTGANFRVEVDKTYGTSLHLGAWARPVRNTEGVNLDAIVIMAGIEYNQVLLGVSYDLNLPNIQKYRRTANVFEISLIYLGEYENDELLCPTF
jgi:type IX secretion system PorP/SprF family membrane protein